MTRASKPDFICIGPTKTGTSWLWTVLRLHPEVWLPPISEVNFYWGTGKRMSKNSPWQTFKQRIKGDIRIRWRRTYFNERWKRYRQDPTKRHFKDIWWDIRYLFMPQNPLWYKSLFKADKLAGDITGGYFMMDDQAIALLAKHLPHAKIIMSFRDPVTRLWSEARMFFMHLQGKQYSEIAEQEFYVRFDRAFERLPSYVQLYERWRKHFPKEQILVCYYDDLQSDPKTYLERICRFLNISPIPTQEMEEAMQQKIFEGVRIALPEQFRKYLIARTKANVEELSAVTGDPQPKEWLRKYEENDER